MSSEPERSKGERSEAEDRSPPSQTGFRQIWRRTKPVASLNHDSPPHHCGYAADNIHLRICPVSFPRVRQGFLVPEYRVPFDWTNNVLCGISTVLPAYSDLFPWRRPSEFSCCLERRKSQLQCRLPPTRIFWGKAFIPRQRAPKERGRPPKNVATLPPPPPPNLFWGKNVVFESFFWVQQLLHPTPSDNFGGRSERCAVFVRFFGFWATNTFLLPRKFKIFCLLVPIPPPPE